MYTIGTGTCRPHATPQFHPQAPSVNRFRQARPNMAMHRDRQSNNLFSQ
jgi:hypothetical protein